MTTELSVIIINYFSEDLVLTCIESIRESGVGLQLEIIIVDNGSSTSKLDFIDDKGIIILRNHENKGFGYACNQGVKQASSEYVLFLNPDTRVFKNTLPKALEIIKNNSEITVLGCQQVDEEGNIIATCTTQLNLGKYLVKSFYLNKLLPKVFKSHHMHYWNHDESLFVEHIMGSFYLIKKSDFKNLGGFDESYFVYFEDLDLSKRILLNNGKLFFTNEVLIYHEGGGASKQVKSRRLFYSLDSVLNYSKKYFGSLEFVFMYLFVMFVEPMMRLVNALVFFNFKSIAETIKAYILLYKKRFNLK